MKDDNYYEDVINLIAIITVAIIFILLFANFYKNLILKQEKINVLKNINNITTNATIVIN